MSQDAACNYGTGEAAKKCLKTCGKCSSGASSGASSSSPCADSTTWKDVDGDGCKVYADYIAKGAMTRSAACNYGNGGAAKHCQQTCGQCSKEMGAMNTEPSACADKACVGDWLVKTGQCYQCHDWASRCDEPAFSKDCPETCGLCGSPAEGSVGTAPAEALPPDSPVAKASAAACEDQECIKNWGEPGQCNKCEDYAADYCGNDRAFMEACPRSCKLCSAEVTAQAACMDDFKQVSCQEYKDLGWCDQPDISHHCKATCGLCTASAANIETHMHAPILNIPDSEPGSIVAPQQTKAAVSQQEAMHEQGGHPRGPHVAQDEDDDDSEDDSDGDDSQPVAAHQKEESPEQPKEDAEDSRKPLPPAFVPQSASSRVAMPSLLLLLAATAAATTLVA